MWQEAASMAARLHQGQFRKDGRTPYVAHCWRVAMTIRHVFGCADEPTIAAALLHDLIEDTTADYDEIAEALGAEVADLVAAMTKNMALPESEREREYDRRLAAADWRARLIKLADTLDNLSEAGAAERARAAEKARRAIALARTDAATHAESRAGVEAIERLLAG
ncbi:MAG: HD domain-containing protein [Phycisphaerales bacterium JB039]